MMSFRQALAELINMYSIEQASNTPDYVLAIYIEGCLEAWNKAMRKRDLFYGKTDKAGGQAKEGNNTGL